MIPELLYHGTTQRFRRFSLDKACPEAFLGAAVYLSTSEYDAEQFYASPNSPDLCNRVSLLADTFDLDSREKAEAKARRILVGKDSRLLTCRHTCKNVATMYPYFNPRNTFITLYSYNEELDEIEYTPEFHIIDAFFREHLCNAYDYSDGEIQLHELRNTIARCYNYDDISPGELFRNLLIKLGYDAVLMCDIPSWFPMYSRDFTDVNHLIVFNPDNVKIVRRETVEF